jgi:pre-mRNA-processing factor 8
MLNTIPAKNLNYLPPELQRLQPQTRENADDRRAQKSRSGNAFHLCREILRLTTRGEDAGAMQYRLGNAGAFQLADSCSTLLARQTADGDVSLQA